ncbi:IclR family transcriptional regulator [Pseudorhodoferax sp.]|uniref:IclR family transcriptional regulator n=1 Tax=Pseudorhodoferax sp. TaxID=1993553 RepID=UPI0039E6A0B2
MSSSSTVTTTLARGLQVLRAFRATRLPLTNAELVRRTGLSRSSVSRFTNTLVNLGYLRRASGGPEFELAWGGFALGYAYAKTNPVTQLAHPLMQRLADRLDVTVALAVPDRLDMLYIGYCSSQRIATLRLDVGSLLPMGRTSVGRAWLGASPLRQRKRYLVEILQAAGPEAEALKQRIEAAFDDLRATGVCMVVNEYQRNTYGIALPVRVGRSRVLMALSCGAADPAPDVAAIRSRVVPELKSAAQELKALLRRVDAEP